MTREGVAANAPAKYLLRGGPMDGELVDPPPGILGEVADALAEGLAGRRAGTPRITGEGWVYEFSPSEAGVLVGRPADEEELRFGEAMAEIVDDLREAEKRAAHMRELSPHVLATLRQAHRLLDGNQCAAARRDDVAIFVARGQTAHAWAEALEQLGPEFGCKPEDVPDEWWNRDA